MKKLRLVTAPSPILRETARRVVIFDARLQLLAQQMYSAMVRNGGIGIAAPQVAVPRRVMIVWNGDSATKPVVCVNPEITVKKGAVVMEEGCLSFPGISREIERPETVCVRFQNLKGKWESAELSGILSRCFQHELDHLNGRLFIDYEDKAQSIAPGDTAQSA